MTRRLSGLSRQVQSIFSVRCKYYESYVETRNQISGSIAEITQRKVVMHPLVGGLERKIHREILNDSRIIQA